MAVTELTGESFFDKINSSEKCLVDFYAQWCVPCKMLSAVIDELSEEIDGVDFFKLDVDECPSIAEKYGIDRIPYVAVMKNGVIVSSHVGHTTKTELSELIGRS